MTLHLHAPVTLWLNESELTRALESCILRDVEPGPNAATYWTERSFGAPDTYVMIARRGGPGTSQVEFWSMMTDTTDLTMEA